MSEAAENFGNTQAVSRRSIVKTAAWTAPVIAAAVAAPMAAASPRSAAVVFSPAPPAAPAALTWTNWDGGGGSRGGTGPTQFSIINTSGAIAAGITGTLVVQANTTPASGLKAKGLG